MVQKQHLNIYEGLTGPGAFLMLLECQIRPVIFPPPFQVLSVFHLKNVVALKSGLLHKAV